MIDLGRQLKILIRTGKFSLGTAKALEAARSGRTKIILLASNCPELSRSDIVRNSKISGVPVYNCDGTGSDLAAMCEKPFTISAISVIEPGDSEILKLVGS